MTREEYHDLLCSLPKEVLIAVIEKMDFRRDESTIVGEHWNFLAQKALSIREKAMGIGKYSSPDSPEYKEHRRLWAQADYIDHQADKIFAELEKSYGKS